MRTDGLQVVKYIDKSYIESHAQEDVSFNATSRVMPAMKPALVLPRTPYRKIESVVQETPLFGVCIYTDQNRAMIKVVGKLGELEHELRYLMIDKTSVVTASRSYYRIRPIEVRIGVAVSILVIEKRREHSPCQSGEELFDQPTHRIQLFSPTQPATKKERICYKTDFNLPDSQILSCFWGSQAHSLETIDVDIAKAGIHGHECANTFIIEAYSIPNYWKQEQFGKYVIWVEDQYMKKAQEPIVNGKKRKRCSSPTNVHWYTTRVVPQHNMSGVPPFVESVYNGEDEYTSEDILDRDDLDEGVVADEHQMSQYLQNYLQNYCL